MNLPKILIILGAFLILVGAFLMFSDKIPFINRLGRLPGDIRIEGKNSSFYFPLATSLVISIVLSGILWIIQGLRR